MENIRCGTTIRTLVFLKNRCSSESDVICSFKMLFNLTMHLSELGTMTLINDKYNLLILVCIHYSCIFRILDSICHLLNRCNNHLFLRWFQHIDKYSSAVRIVYTVFFKTVIFINGLVIKVFSVNQEYDQIYHWFITQKLCQLEWCQRLSWTCTGKYITILIYL